MTKSDTRGPAEGFSELREKINAEQAKAEPDAEALKVLQADSLKAEQGAALEASDRRGRRRQRRPRRRRLRMPRSANGSCGRGRRLALRKLHFEAAINGRGRWMERKGN